MRMWSRRNTVLVVHVLASYLLIAAAQFGVPQKEHARVAQLRQEIQVDAVGNTAPTVDDSVVDALLDLSQTVEGSGSSTLTRQEALDMAAILHQAARDQETRQMVLNMKKDQFKTIETMRESSSGRELLIGMQKILQEMKHLEILFKDKQQALKLMNEDGMIEPEKLPLYQANPDLLEQDTRKGMYFAFVSLACAAGFL